MAVFYTSQTYEKGCSNDSAKFAYYLTADLISQSVANNQSVVTFRLYLYPTAVTNKLRWDTAYAYAPYGNITLDGTTYPADSSVDTGSASSQYFIDDGRIRRFTRTSQHLLIAEKTLTIQHNSDGTKSIPASFKWQAGSGSTTAYYPATFTSNGATITIPPIARSGTIDCDSAILLSTDATAPFEYTVTSYANYYYDLSWTLDGNTTTVWTKHSLNNTSTVLNIARSTLASKITTGTQKNLVLTLKAYENSSDTTPLGTVTKTVVVTVDTSDTTGYKPSTVINSITPDTTPISGYLIAGYSTAKINYRSTRTTNLATTLHTLFSINKGTLASEDVTALSGNILTNLLPASQADYDFTVTAKARDTRGVESAPATRTSPTVYGYKLPTITANVIRVSGQGSTTEDDAGEYVYITYSGNVGASINGQNAIVSSNCEFNGNSYANGSWAPLPAENEGTFTFTVADRISSVTATVTVPEAVYPLDLYDDGTAQHMGVGLAGAAAEADKVSMGKVAYGIDPDPTANGQELPTIQWLLDNFPSGGTVDPAIDPNSSNPVENQAIAAALDNITKKTVITNAVTRTAGATITDQKLVICNNVAFLYLLLTRTSSVASNGDLFTGTLNSAYAPAAICTGSGRYSAHAFGGVLQTDGSIDVRNIAASAVTPSTGVWISFTYILGG